MIDGALIKTGSLIFKDHIFFEYNNLNEVDSHN
jgi:hypothetical protein